MTDAWPLPPAYNLAQCLERLPPHAQNKHALLKAQLDDAIVLVRALMERVTAAERKFGEISRRRAFAITARNEVALAEVEAELSHAGRQVGKLRAELATRNAVRANHDQVLGRVENFVRTLFSGAVELVPPPWPERLPPLQHEGEGLLDALERTRREIGGLQSELARVRAAPLPMKEVRAAIADQVARMARAGTPRLAVSGTTVELSWPDLPPIMIPNMPFNAPPGSASKLMAWLFADKIVAELVADLPVTDSPGAIASADRPARLRALEGKICALECVEEKLVLTALGQGLDVLRRSGADVWAVLYTTFDDEEVAVAEAAE